MAHRTMTIPCLKGIMERGVHGKRRAFSISFSLCGKVACGLLHDRLSHPKRAFLDLKGTTAAGSVCHHSKPQSPVKPSSSVPMIHFLSCEAYLQPWDKNSYDLRHLQESTINGVLWGLKHHRNSLAMSLRVWLANLSSLIFPFFDYCGCLY
ncbi:hypothetical protein ALC53_12605 [Atta colombica]|uniref:Uncharacterized protein n=1 Tax=Atta colombica TaxID=520822 RepID=A0A151HZ58_9HYME|nr:hypothetical protein ALC53_12605 [Atta colombica]